MFLPPEYIVRGKGMFSLRLSVHPLGCTPVSGPRSLPSLWSHVLSGGDTPACGPMSWLVGGGGYLRTGVLARTGLGSCPPPHQDRTGTPSLDRTWVPPPGTGYAAGGMPLAVSRRTFLLIFIQHLTEQIYRRTHYRDYNRDKVTECSFKK